MSGRERESVCASLSVAQAPSSLCEKALQVEGGVGSFSVGLATTSGGVSYPQASVRTLIELLARVHEGVRPVGAAIG